MENKDYHPLSALSGCLVVLVASQTMVAPLCISSAGNLITILTKFGGDIRDFVPGWPAIAVDASPVASKPVRCMFVCSRCVKMTFDLIILIRCMPENDVSQNITTLSRRDFDRRESISIFFCGRCYLENSQLLVPSIFALHLTSASALPGEMKKDRIASFPQMLCIATLQAVAG